MEPSIIVVSNKGKKHKRTIKFEKNFLNALINSSEKNTKIADPKIRKAKVKELDIELYYS